MFEGPPILAPFFKLYTMDIEIKLNKLEADFLTRFLCDALEKLQEKTDIRNPHTYNNKLFIDTIFNVILQTNGQLTEDDFKQIDKQNKINAAKFYQADNISDK